MQVMECVSAWPLLQRNKIEDSKINVAVQGIADAPIPEGETTVAAGAVKPEETPKLQEVKTECSEPTILEPTETNADEPVIKREHAEPADILVSTDSTNDATPMTVDEPNLQSERGRTAERHESQAMKLKRFATKVFAPRSTQSGC